MKSTAPAAPETNVEQVFRNVRDDIVKCRLSPGAKLNIQECSTTYGVGTTPVREALSRLAATGLVLAQGNRGFRVSELSIDDLVDLTKARLWIEEYVLRRSIALGDLTWESDIIARAHQLGLSKVNSDKSLYLDETWEERHFDFHAALVGGCDSRYLYDYWERMFVAATRYRRWSAVNFPGERDVEDEHRAIMDATLARDADKATALMREHMIKLVVTIVGADPKTATDPSKIAEQISDAVRFSERSKD